MTLAEAEKNHLIQTLIECKGNKRQTARVLGIYIKTLYRKLYAHGLAKPRSWTLIEYKGQTQ